jgi:hypothetical protein
MLEHPVITRLLATGSQELARRGGRVCCDCGGSLLGGDSYYCVAGLVFCEGCMKLRREEVEL